jgi:hypothetical protein
MTIRFQEPNHKLAPKFCTYTLDGGFHFRKACAYDTIISCDDADSDYLSRMEFDLAHDLNGEAEILCVRIYNATHEFIPIKSPALEEIACQYLQDGKARWEAACDYLNDNGDLIECERAAA